MADVMKEVDEDQDKHEVVILEDDPNKDQDDDRVAKNSEDNDEGGTDAEREAIRERRRLEKLERKDRRDKAITRDKTELDFLRKRNDELERRMSEQEKRAYQADLNKLEAQIAAAAREAEMADKVIAKAVTAGNGDDVTQAMRYRDQAMARLQQLNQSKHQASQMPMPNQADDGAMQYAKEFLNENKWYDIHGKDEDSAIVLAIDQTLSREGFDPRSEEYWDELRTRAARRLPEKFKTKSTVRSPRGGPEVGSGREHAPTSTRTEIYLSPERKQALIEAGVWDDPVLRRKYAMRYSEYDRANRS